MGSIKISNVSFRYEDSSNHIFNNLNLDLDSSWKLGLVGRNGRGKTTFLNLLQGKLVGRGEIQTKLNFSYYPIRIKDPANITLYELQDQIMFEQWKLERELNLMHVDSNLIWQSFNTLSGGEQTKILLALSFIDENSFPLIDEPTNHLDEESRQEICKYLTKHHKGYIVVSHDRNFLNQVTDHVLAIENTEIHLYQGNYATYEQIKEARDEFNREKNEKIAGEIKNLHNQKEQFYHWAQKIEARKNLGQKTQYILNRRARVNKAAIGHAAAKMMKKSITRRNRMDKKIEEKEGLMVNIEDIPKLTMNFQSNYHSAFLKFLLNKVSANSNGRCELTNGLRISYLPQDLTIYQGSLKNFALHQKLSYEDLLNILKKMGFPHTNFNVPIEEMSMGQQKRIALAKSLLEPADLYLWDEPANYLDVFNQDQLINLLQEVKPAMLLIDHDQYFIEQVADERIKLAN
ncbi:ABC transporter ATPase component [Lactobacillus johnsonii DPC 6026]|uniref:ATP-binding cassette domain-containing protein n=1 Tax=Lactobacillus johnsonii TaxID=33959 RepID=UPI000207BD6D|nr:ATP-binding cassette domain-containing protein [Lactobacillus johnsonii]AEB93369.1 ABC transporter ATPase component [Lactobacillus johnsonii DPC 6026]MCI6882312.1 ATP-binding cassette domain-containing protein [Lactobacillus johnsonii]